MIKNTYGDGIINLYKADQYGGVDITASMQPLYREALEWLVIYRYEVEQEKRLREESTAVKNAWEQYQVVKTLAMKETSNA